jgi:hypothetical protein
VYNVPELLVCCLPYHATPEFARLVALLQLKGSAWEWLGPCQQSGAPPPRDLLVRRCVNDQVRGEGLQYYVVIVYCLDCKPLWWCCVLVRRCVNDQVRALSA